MITYSDKEKKDLVHKVELYRLDKGLSVKSLADILQVNSGTIRHWEDGISLPNKVQCYQISKLTNNFTPKVLK